MHYIYQILFLLLLCKNSKSFTFKQCTFANCLEDIYEQADFTSDFVNNLYSQNQINNYIRINATDVSELTLNLDNFNHNINIRIISGQNQQLTINTNMNEISAHSCLPSIYADEADVIINNLNEKNERTLFVVGSFEYKSLSIKNPSKPLYLIHYFYNSYSYSINPNIKLDAIYVGSRHYRVDLSKPIENSLKIIVSPILNYTTPNDNHKEDFLFLKEASCIITTPKNTLITYGKRQIKYEFDNKKILTLISETPRIRVDNYVINGSIIDVENDLSSTDIIFPEISNYAGSSNITIKGNWPIINDYEIPGEFMENGSYISSSWNGIRIHGNYIFTANHFPFAQFNGVKFILTKKSSSIYIADEYSGNLTIETDPQNSDDEFVFFIEGIAIELGNDTLENNDGTTKEEYNAIFTSSEKLTIVANTYSEIQVFGPASIIYKKIDNANQMVQKTLNFLQGGSINIPFSVDYMEIASSLTEIFNSYKSDHTPPDKNAKAAEWTNYAIDFAKNKITDLSSKINSMANQVVPITVDLKQKSYSGNQKNRIVLLRSDIPISAFYQNGLNKVSNAVCLNSGTLDINNWDVRIGTSMFRELFGIYEGNDEDLFFDRYLPTISETNIGGEIISNENGKCIAFKPTSIPGSSFELIIYTSNTTYSEILEKISLFTTLTPSDLDAFAKLKNSKSKNFFVFVINDLPDGKSINLNGIREDSNVFLFGFKENQMNDILTMVDDLNAINWSSDDSDLLSNQIYKKIASRYENYQPKASITFGTVQSFMVGSINYVGTHIKCQNFYPIISKFSNIDSLANDFSADVTLTESITYKLIEKLQFNDLIIFPVSINPPNIFVVDQIDFTESKWTLKLTAFVQSPGLEIEGSSNYEINTAKVSGQLIVYSFTSNCIFNVPDTKEKQKIKGITINSHFTNFNIKEIPGIMILEDTNSVEKIKNLLKYAPLQFMHELIDIVLKPSSIITKLTNLGLKNNRKVIREGEEEQEKIIFQGNWDKVETITGTIEINTGDSPAIIESIPAVVSNVLEVKSTQNVQLEAKSTVMRFLQPQIITQAKTISFSNEKMDVTFSNLTFKGDSTSLSLMINGKASKVITDHVVLTSRTTSFLRGELEVKQSFEFGPLSSLIAEKITTNKPKLTMNYRLSDKFGTIPDSIEPDSIVLNYIGESNGDSIPDYDAYLGSINDVKTFSGENHLNKCNEWKGKTTLYSFKYPEFKGENPVVEVICIDKKTFSTLSVNLTSSPSGIIQIPDNDIGNDGDVKDKDSSKKKFPVGAIIGIAVGGVAVVAIVSVLIWFFVFKKKKVQGTEDESNP